MSVGYCGVAAAGRTRQAAGESEAEPYAGPLTTARMAHGPAGRKRSFEEYVYAAPLVRPPQRLRP